MLTKSPQRLKRANEESTTIKTLNQSLKKCSEISQLYLLATALNSFMLIKEIATRIVDSILATFPIRIRSVAQKIRVGERGDVPGWVLVVLMTTALVTAIWTIAQPRLSAILRNSLDSMNNVR